MSSADGDRRARLPGMRPALVLAYHGLGRFPRALDPYNLMLDPARFREQVQALRGRGYRFVSLAQIGAHLRHGTPPEGVCALTFDDGTCDNLELLAPLLVELELPASIFVCPGLLGSAHFAMPAQAGVRLMDAQQLRELASAARVEIGSHTNTHCDLSTADGRQALAEMRSSKDALEQLLGRQVRTFAYPKCGYSPSCPDAAARAGYELAVTCEGRGGWRPFELARESITSLDGRLAFALKSRRLYLPLRNSPPGTLARALARPVRHRTG
ncbi:MAG TPA: polysaccharide deacetylase family protein [Solirubrobacteraceae bacterium]|nr:polysaccharide deacetylase family protein [Solirubrobacteraceae bacterium]